MESIMFLDFASFAAVRKLWFANSRSIVDPDIRVRKLSKQNRQFVTSTI